MDSIWLFKIHDIWKVRSVFQLVDFASRQVGFDYWTVLNRDGAHTLESHLFEQHSDFPIGHTTRMCAIVGGNLIGLNTGDIIALPAVHCKRIQRRSYRKVVTTMEIVVGFFMLNVHQLVAGCLGCSQKPEGNHVFPSVHEDSKKNLHCRTFATSLLAWRGGVEAWRCLVLDSGGR